MGAKWFKCPPKRRPHLLPSKPATLLLELKPRFFRFRNKFIKNRTELLKTLDMESQTLLQKDTISKRWTMFSWTPSSTHEGYHAEESLLKRMLSFGESTSKLTKARSGLVEIEENQYINTLIMKDDGTIPDTLTGIADNTKQNLVMTHGYGAGLGFYYKTYADIASVRGWDIYSLDWLGMANSSRPPFVKTSRHATEDEIVTNTEHFFIDSLEKWRAKMGLEKMVLFR